MHTMLRETFDISFDADAESASLLESAYERFADEARDNLFAVWSANKRGEQWDHINEFAHLALMADAIKAGADQSMIGQRLIDLANESLRKFVAANLEDECEALLQHAILIDEIDAGERMADARDDR